MDNILYKFIADRDSSITDHIERYCLFENKESLDVVRVVFYFLQDTIKPRLENAFVRACLSHITKNADERVRRMLMNETALGMRFKLKAENKCIGCEDRLRKIEGGNAPITAFMKSMLDEDKTETERFYESVEHASGNNWFFGTFLEGLYIGEDSAIKVRYKNSFNEIVEYLYTRGDFVVDFDLVDAMYDHLAGVSNENKGKYDTLKLSSNLSDNQLKKIKSILIDNNFMTSTSDENFLYWFGRDYPDEPIPLKWNAGKTTLANIMQMICDDKDRKPGIRVAFHDSKFDTSPKGDDKNTLIIKDSIIKITKRNQKDANP